MNTAKPISFASECYTVAVLGGPWEDGTTFSQSFGPFSDIEDTCGFFDLVATCGDFDLVPR